MLHAAILPPLALAVVFVVSGVGKLRSPETVEASFRDLKVPAALGAPWLRKAFPWAEILLAVLLLVAPGALAPVVAVAALVLCCVYWVLIRRALGFEEPVSCGCFGEASAEPIGPRTLLRNTVLVLLALLWLLASFVAGVPALLLGMTGAHWLWVLGAALVAALVWFSVPTGSVADGAGAGEPVPQAPTDEDGEYLRAPIPGVMLRTEEGPWTPLQDLCLTRARLLVLVSPGCGPCTKVLNQAREWQDLLGPAVALTFMTEGTAEQVHALVPEEFWAEMLYDEHGFASRLLQLYRTPAAVLLGADGYLAGGPVFGPGEISDFVQDIHEQLAEAPAPERPAMEYPGEERPEA